MWQAAEMWAAALLVPASIAPAQIRTPPEVNLFGDEIVRPLHRDPRGRFEFDREAAQNSLHTKMFPHILLFRDGRQLHGTLVELTSDTVIWRHPDFSKELRVARREVRRLVLAQSRFEALTETQIVTAKLPGGDWLAGDLTSADGRTFALRLPRGARWTLPRAQLAWLSFGLRVAPASGIGSTPLDLESWETGTGAGWVQMRAGMVTIHNAGWFGTTVPMPMCIEIAFTIPAESEDGLRLWLQPQTTQPAAIGPKSIKCDLGSRKFSYLRGVGATPGPPIPIDNGNAAGQPVHYQVFQDGVGRRFAVSRNRQMLGSWRWEDADDFATDLRVIFERAPEVAERTLKFQDLRVRPWDGVIPGEFPPSPEGQRVDGASLAGGGDLTAVTATDLTFAGVTRARTGGTFIQLSGEPRPLPKADALLRFGQNGQVAVDGLTFRHGVARGQSSFAANLEIAEKELETIVLHDDAPEPEGAGPVLVFQNGDELRGKVLSAVSGKPLRCETRGQLLEIAPGRMAGVRFHEPPEGAPADDAACVELRNGDLLRVALAGFDSQTVRIEHGQLGVHTIARAEVRSLYLMAQLSPGEAARSGTWLAGVPDAAVLPRDHPRPAARRFVSFDGCYILRGELPSYSEVPDLRRVIPAELARYELRCAFTSVLDGCTGFSLSLKNRTKSNLVRISSFNDRFYVWPIVDGRSGKIKSIRLEAKLPARTNRPTVRLFVDSLAGTVAIYLDGVFIVMVGDDPTERLLGVGVIVGLDGDCVGMPTLISDLWIGPWSGELPKPGSDERAGTLLANHDVIPGVPSELRAGKFLIESEAGPLALEAERVRAIDFGGLLAPRRAPARVRLVDGSALLLEDFRWDGAELVARSVTLGEIRLPREALCELVFDPRPAHAPKGPLVKKMAKTLRAGEEEK